MNEIWLFLLAIGVPTTAVAFAFRRVERRMDKERDEREALERTRAQHELYTVKMLTATAALCEAEAIAMQNGKCNGETHRALDRLKEVKNDQRDFLIAQGIDHIMRKE